MKSREKMNSLGVSISNEKPPVFDACVKQFDISWGNTIFAYDPHIHTANSISDDIVEHELIHIKQQRDFGGVEKWWKVYLENDEMRLKWEIEAYRVQYKFLKEIGMERNELFRHVHFWATQLSGESYGKIISYTGAIKNITS